MKKILLSLSVMALAAPGAIAQQAAQELPAVKSVEETANAPTQTRTAKQSSVSSAAVIWTEDFSGGIPSSWTNEGFVVDPGTGALNPNTGAEWEYRGPSTTPSNAVGSRGAYAGDQLPLNSPTGGNGFIIFDSDYIDNNGDPATMGQGVAPAPHIGTLTTDVIDLTGHPNVQLSMNSYARVFFAEFLVAVSNDGGATFADTVEFHSDLAVNESSPNGEEIFANISAAAGDESMVVLQFIFDGRPGNANGNSYYFWMMDDLVISDLPPYQIQFVEWNEAPDHDVIVPAGYAKYGHVNKNQVVPMDFDSNILNYGSEELKNLRLAVVINDATTGTNLDTLFSPAYTMASGTTLGWDSLNTELTGDTWTPPGVGTYDIIYTAISDSIPAAAGSLVPRDTFTFRVTDETSANPTYSFDWNTIDNYVGTNSSGTGTVTAIGKRFNFPSPNPDTSGYVYVEGMDVLLSEATDPTASITIEVYDTASFDFDNGFSGNPVGSFSYQLDAGAPGTMHHFSFQEAGQPLELASGNAYYVHMMMFPNETDGVVRIANDASFSAAPRSIILEVDGNQWFGGFDSRALESPFMRLQMTKTPSIGIEEITARNGISLYPNPSNGQQVNLEIEQRGTYTVEVMNLLGKVVSSEKITIDANEKLTRDFSSFSKGVYLLNISNGEFNSTHKLTIE